MLGALVVHSRVKHIVKDERGALLWADGEVEAWEGGVPARRVGHVIQIDEKGEMAARLLREVA